jgi:hypothetical protein
MLVNLDISFEESWDRSKTKFKNKENFKNYISKFITFNEDPRIESIDLSGTSSVNSNVNKIAKILGYNVNDA